MQSPKPFSGSADSRTASPSYWWQRNRKNEVTNVRLVMLQGWEAPINCKQLLHFFGRAETFAHSPTSCFKRFAPQCYHCYHYRRRPLPRRSRRRLLLLLEGFSLDPAVALAADLPTWLCPEPMFRSAMARAVRHVVMTLGCSKLRFTEGLRSDASDFVKPKAAYLNPSYPTGILAFQGLEIKK